MVKNKGGGNKAKGLARKNVQTKSKTDKPLRISMEEDEVYAFVTKLYGNGMCEVFCLDDQVRLCHIRGIFRGRSRRDNCVESGTWVLVGVRSYETVVKDKRQNCDLLEVYNKQEKERLQNAVSNLPWNKFLKRENVENYMEDDELDNFTMKFADATETEYLDLMAKIQETGASASVADMNAILGDKQIDLDDL